MTDEYEQGDFLGHFACPKHGSTDSLGLYKKDDHVDGYCFSECGKLSAKELKDLGVTDGGLKVLVEPTVKSNRKRGYILTEDLKEKLLEIEGKEIHGWSERRIPKIVNEFYGVRSDVEGEGSGKVLLKEFCPAYDQNDNLVGFHCRDDLVKQAKNNGEKVDKPPFFSIGDVRASTKLFGQNKFQGGGKTVVLCSGQADARAVFTALNTKKEGGKSSISQYITPVVSTQCGESSVAQIKSNYEWLTSFEKVIILYDQDEAGRLGAQKIAKMMKAGQAKIGKYRRKDACEHSKRGEWSEIKTAYFQAEQYSPVDVIHLAEMWDSFANEDEAIKISFPPSMSKLNEMMNGGMERGEITTVGMLTSAGKSTIINNCAHYWLESTNLKVGAFFLEGTKREVVRDLLSLELRRNLRLPQENGFDMDDLKKRFMQSLAAQDNFVYVDHQGAISNEEIFDKFNYLAEVEDIDVLIFDPIQAAVNSSSNDSMIEFMDRLLKFAKKTNVAVLAVSHMRKPQSDDPHNVSEYDLLGSSAINQISFNTIIGSRDKLHSNPIVKNATHLLLVKCRRTGNTGDAGWVRFDAQTAHLYATTDPYENIGDEEDAELFGNTVAEDGPEQYEPPKEVATEDEELFGG